MIAMVLAMLLAGALPPPDNPANGLTGHWHVGR